MLRNFVEGIFGPNSYIGIYWLLKLYPIWLPILLGILFWQIWLRYIRYSFFFKTKMVLLEIRLPKEITKSPAAMELVLMSLYQTSGESNFISKYWDGKVRPWFSLELVSEGGQVRFLIWTREVLRNLIESQIYSQYPEVEIHEVDDYAKKVDYQPEINEMWACHYVLGQKDPLPLKSYIDYGLDQNPKEEFKIDPLTSVLEFFSTLKPGENVWLQFVVRAHKKEKREGLFSKGSDWMKDVDDTRAELIRGIKQVEGRTVFSDLENQLLDAIQREYQKLPFDVGIRCIYIAEKSLFSMGGTVAGLRGLMKPFSFNSAVGEFKVEFDAEKPEKNKTRHFAGFNSLKFDSSTDTDYPWDDFMNMRMHYQKRKKLDAYKRRMFFYEPYTEKTNVMTTETLATLFHFPGSVAAAPGLTRIDSKRGQPPTNLPV